MIIRAIALPSIAILLNGCGALPALPGIMSGISAAAGVYSLANSAADDYSKELITACYDWHASAAKASQLPNAGSAKAQSIKSFGDAECVAIARGDKPVGGAFATGVWLHDVEKQNTEAAGGGS